MDNNQRENQPGYNGGGGYTSPEEPYNPDAQYGFSGSYSQNPASGTFQNSSGQYQSAADLNQSGQYQSAAGQNQFGQYQTSAGPNEYSGGYQYSGGNPNGNYNNYNRNQGGVPLDRKGQPMKNNFGMKLTFSIIEIVIGACLSLAQSWCFGLIPLGLSIVACVMVCMQNKHYREGSWSSFVSAKKISNVLMWVAFGFYMAFLVLFIVILVIALVAGASILGMLSSDLTMDSLQDLKEAYESGEFPGSDNYEYDNDYSYDYDDLFGEESDDGDDFGGAGAYSTIDGENLYIDGFHDFKLDGNRLSLPVDMKEFYKAGFLMNEEDMDTLIPADNYDGYAYYDAEGNYLGTVFVYNVTGKELKVSEGIAGGITINNYEDVELELVNGITFDTSADVAVAALGSPTGASGSDKDVTLEWYMNNRYGSSLELDYWDGELTEVWIMNYLPLEQ